MHGRQLRRSDQLRGDCSGLPQLCLTRAHLRTKVRVVTRKSKNIHLHHRDKLLVVDAVVDVIGYFLLASQVEGIVVIISLHTKRSRKHTKEN